MDRNALFVNPKTFARVQDVLTGHNRPRYSKREIAFRGLMTCAHDGCQLTGDVQKEKYVYYRCTGYHGKCELPRFREEDIGERLGEPLKGLQVPPEIVSQIVTMLREDQSQSADRVNTERTRLESRLARSEIAWMQHTWISSTARSARTSGSVRLVIGGSKSRRSRCQSKASKPLMSGIEL